MNITEKTQYKTDISIICNCPNCTIKQLEVIVANCGLYFDSHNYKMVYWFEGNGKCNMCDWEGYYKEKSE